MRVCVCLRMRYSFSASLSLHCAFLVILWGGSSVSALSLSAMNGLILWAFRIAEERIDFFGLDMIRIQVVWQCQIVKTV